MSRLEDIINVHRVKRKDLIPIYGIGSYFSRTGKYIERNDLSYKDYGKYDKTMYLFLENLTLFVGACALAGYFTK